MREKNEIRQMKNRMVKNRKNNSIAMSCHFHQLIILWSCCFSICHSVPLFHWETAKEIYDRSIAAPTIKQNTNCGNNNSERKKTHRDSVMWNGFDVNSFMFSFSATPDSLELFFNK